jgi:hypothetical protein
MRTRILSNEIVLVDPLFMGVIFQMCNDIRHKFMYSQWCLLSMISRPVFGDEQAVSDPDPYCRDTLWHSFRPFDQESARPEHFKQRMNGHSLMPLSYLLIEDQRLSSFVPVVKAVVSQDNHSSNPYRADAGRPWL